MLLWDSLFLLLVLLPLFTGGVWWRGTHFYVEYTEPGIAAALLALWLWRRGDPKQSRVYSFGIELWEGWVRGLSERPALFLGAACAVNAALWSLTSLLRHRAFGSGLADLGIFTNAISNVSRLGYPMSSLKDGISLLADHQIFLFYPLGWLFPLWPSPVFLLVLQSLALSFGGVALYLLGRQRLGATHWAVPWLPFTLWMAGPIRAAGRFDFHPEVFMLPLFLLAAYLLQEASRSRRIAGAAVLLLALAAKESAGPVACGLGLAWLLGAGPADTRRFTRPLGAAMIAAGLAVFIFDSRFMPGLIGASYAYSDLYEPLPATLAGLALAPFTQPGLFFGRLFTWSRLKFLCGTLLPTAFLPFLAPLAALASVPGFLMLFLTSGEHRISLGYHYAIEPMTGLFFALPAALDSAFARRHARALLPLLILAALFSYGRSDPYFWRIYSATPHQAWVRDEVLPLVPEKKSVAASYALVPHLSVRRWVNQPVSLIDKTGAPVDCLLLDKSVNNLGMNDLDSLLAQAHGRGFAEELRCGSFLLLKGPGVDSCLSAPPPLCREQR